jgi:hypothetical protein
VAGIAADIVVGTRKAQSEEGGDSQADRDAAHAMTIFDRCKPAIFAELQESISEGFFVWVSECWLLQLQG